MSRSIKDKKENMFLMNEEDLSEISKNRKLEYNKIYQQEHRKEINKKAVERRQKNKERDKEKLEAYYKEWYKNHAEEAKQKAADNRKKYSEAYKILRELYNKKCLNTSHEMLIKIKVLYEK